MQIETVLMSLNHPLVPANRSFNPQLYLGVISNDQLTARCGFKTSPEFYGPWNALKVRIGTGKPSGSGSVRLHI